MAVFWCLVVALASISANHLSGSSSLAQCSSLNGRALKLGVKYEVSAALTVQTLNATFGQYLSNFMKRYGCQGGVEMVPYSHAQMQTELTNSLTNPDQASVDVAFVSPGIVAGFHRLYPDISVLATIRDLHLGVVSSYLAGVLVRQKNSNTNLVSWSDLNDATKTAGKMLCSLATDSFSGFQIQQLESMLRTGKRLEGIFTGGITRCSSHDEVLESVKNGSCHVGTVETGVLERVNNSVSEVSGLRIPIDTWAIIGEEIAGQGNSTRPYPEWGVIALPHLSAELASRVQAGLIGMDEHSDAAAIGHHAGFDFPEDYTEVALVEYHLNFFGDGRCPPGYQRGQTGLRLCDPCPAGSYSPNDVTPCLLCPPRYYNSEPGAASCLRCAQGYSTFQDGSLACVPHEEVAYEKVEACANYQNNTLVFGVLQTLDAAAVRAQWAPTFEDALNKFMNRYDCYTRMEVLNWGNFTKAVENKTIHFGFLDPGLYNIMKYRYQMEAIAAVLRYYQGSATARMGGVTFRKKSGTKNHTFTTLQQVASASANGDLTLCAVNADSFTGYQIQWFSFFNQEIDLNSVFKTIKFSNSHEESVRMVMDGECDVGMASTNTLEEMSRKNTYTLSDFTIINEQNYSNFHLKVSTPLYSEWPLAVMPGVPEEISKLILIPLLHILDDDIAAIVGKHLGFQTTFDFSKSQNVIFQLNLMNPATSACKPGWERDNTKPLKPCKECDAGRYSFDGIGACRLCSPGFANPDKGKTQCQRCPEGEVTYNFGELQCQTEGDRLLYDPIVGCSNYVNNTLTVGVQQVEVSANFTINRWSPTFEETLNTYMNRFKCFFQMKSMRLEELAVAVKNGSVQFAFTDSGVYAQYKHRYQAKAISTVVRYYDGRAYKRQGGVIFRLTRNHTDIFNLSQITKERNLTVCPTDSESFAGWNVQRYEFFKQGIDVSEVFGRIVFSGGHTESVHMVASGACDIGFARTYSIRILINNGIYPANTFTIINEQLHSGFNLQSSSALYSEWAFTVMIGVPEDVSSNAIIPLLGMREFDAASKTGLHAGFVPPRNYAAEENVYFDLDLMNSETHVCAPGRERDNTKPLKPCKDCDAGRYSLDGIGACRPCSPGFANNLTGKTQCQRCPEGQVSYNFGELQCLPEQDRLLYDPIVGCSNYVNNTLTVGVQQAEVLASFTINRWSPTFEETLNTYMNRFKCFFQMKSMRLEELAVAVKNGSVQFAFTDSGVYAQYKHRYQAKAIATVVRYYDGRAYKRQGGVIFRLTRNHTDIFNLSQITKERNLTVCPTDSESFAGWNVQRYEFFKQGIDVNEMFGRIVFSGGHTESVHMVASGACDMGFARTYSIRILINNGIYPADTFTIINEQFHNGFTLQSSSALYSEWAFTVMNGVPEDVSSNAIIPLLGMREFDAASKTGLHAGFVPPRNYAAEENVYFDLDLMNNETHVCAPGRERDNTKPLKPCKDCDAGRYSLDGIGACRPCSPGFANALTGQTQCQRCPEGQVTYNFGELQCLPEQDRLLYDPIEGCSKYVNNTLTVGVQQAEVSASFTINRWSPTFEETLNTYMNRFKCFFQMKSMRLEELAVAVKNGSVQFAFTDSGLYAQYKHRYQAKAIATVVRYYDGRAYKRQGGVIFRLTRNHTDIYNLSQITKERNLTVCPTDSESFAGWNVQRYEFFKQGIDVNEMFGRIVFSGGHTESVHMVASGACDIGFARTYSIRILINSGIYPADTFTIINQQTHSGFNLQSSSALYSEWAFTVMNGVAEDVSSNAIIPLLGMREFDAASKTGLHAGFVPPRNYAAEESVYFDLDLMNSETHVCAPGRERDNTKPLKPCKDCDAGRYSLDGIGACRPCSPGFANALTGQTQCQRCPEGQVTYNFGEHQCLPEQDRLLYDPIVGCSKYVNNTLTVGVQQAELSASFTINRWSPTFEETLNTYMNRFQCFFQMKSMRLEELAVAVKNGSVQFAFTDSGVYAQYKHRYQAKAIATVVRYYDGRAYKRQGGVMFRLTNKHTDIYNLSQITKERNLTVCPTDSESFAGWNVQRYEFFKQGIDVSEVFGRIVFSGGHTESVHMVASGACDIGFARTYSIRILINNGIYPAETFTLINAQTHSGFILQSSSALYSEWAFTVMQGVPEDVSSNAIIPLLGMREFDAASKTGLHAGFVPPRNYAAEENVYFDLDLMNSETHVCAPGRERDNTKRLKPCKDCDAGRYSLDGIGACRPCSPGFANDLTGQTQCQRCPEGQVTYNFGELQCLPEQDRLLYDPIVGCSNYVNNTLTVGVQQAEVSANFTINRWSPTFEETLNTYMNRFKCFFQMKSMRLEELAVAVKNGAVQFAFTDSGVYAQYNQRYQAKALATVVRYYDGRAYKRQGGVIFRLTRNHTDIYNLSQITKERNLTVCPTDSESFAGWNVQRYEFFKQGIDVNEVFGRIVFSGGHTESVHMVASGACDIGFARTYSIRILINSGMYSAETFTIINAQTHSGFTLQSSSALYSEWAFTVMNDVPEDVSSNAIIPLLGMREFDAASKTGLHAGFVPARDYSAEFNVCYQLNLMDPVAGDCAPGSQRDYSQPLKPCVACPVGREGRDGLECLACAPGFYGDKRGLVECKRCPPGFTSRSYGETSCIEMKDTLKYKPIEECAKFDDKTLKVGVVWEASLELAVSRWQPTFEGVLNEYFNRYKCFFKMVPLSHAQTDQAVKKKEVDFLFANSGTFVEYSHSDGLRVLASVLRIFNGIMSPYYGGVMFQRTDPNATEVVTLAGLAAMSPKLVACPPSRDSFVGYQAQKYEFFKLGLKAEEAFSEIVYSGSFDESVKMVANGSCDVGMVRTETLERLVRDGVYKAEDFSIINARTYDDFFQLVSTDLYPEWPFAALPHVPKAITDVVSTPLLALREWDEASIKGAHAGFTTSFSYDSVVEVRYQLALEEGATCGPGAYRDMSTPMQRCEKCKPGEISKTGIGLCVPCPEGWISPKAGGSECSACPFGFYTSGHGSAVCSEYSVTLSLSPGAQYAVWAIVAVLGLFCLSVFLLVIVHRNTKLMKASSVTFNLVFVPLIFVLYVILLSGQSWLAFRVRKLPTVFNESQLIAWLLYNTVFVGIIGVMVDFMLDERAITAKMMVRSVALLLGAITPVFVLYVPKLLEIYRDQMNNSKYSSKDQTSDGTRTGGTQVGVAGSRVPGLAHPSGHGSSVVGVSHNRTGTRPHKSNKGASNVQSALSGLSDAGDEEVYENFQFDIVPDSDVAGDETYAYSSDGFELKGGQKMERPSQITPLDMLNAAESRSPKSATNKASSPRTAEALRQSPHPHRSRSDEMPNPAASLQRPLPAFHRHSASQPSEFASPAEGATNFKGPVVHLPSADRGTTNVAALPTLEASDGNRVLDQDDLDVA
eukprot:g8110.t1